MPILENFENAWDPEFQLGIDTSKPPQTESTPMVETDNMGREKFWDESERSTGAWTKSPAVYDSLTVKLFSETCCTECSCKNG